MTPVVYWNLLRGVINRAKPQQGRPEIQEQKER